MQEAELFFNADDDGKQANWLIFPCSLSSQEMQEILEITVSFAPSIFRNEVYYKFMKIEETLKKNNAYPDPTKFKEFSAWQYAQLKNGAIIYRICYDGRRESKSGRVNSSIEEPFLKVST